MDTKIGIRVAFLYHLLRGSSLMLERDRNLFRGLKAYRRTIVIAATAVLIIPIGLALLPVIGKNAEAAGQSSGSHSVGTTLAFDDGKVVTIQYSQIYFCNSKGPATSATSSPCKIGEDATEDPVPDAASHTLNVIVPAFKGLDGLTPSSSSNTIAGKPGSNSIFDPTLGGNNFTQCPDSTSSLHCVNHPDFVDLVGTGVVPLPIHSHIISGHGNTGAQGGWWELKSWTVTDPSIWPNPNTGECSAGTGCLNSEDALQQALQNGQVSGPAPTSIYLFFNVVGSGAK